MLAVLVVAGFGQAAGHGEDEGHGVFGDGAGVDAGGAGEADVAGGEGCAVELVGAGADGLDEAEFGGDVEQVVAP